MSLILWAPARGNAVRAIGLKTLQFNRQLMVCQKNVTILFSGAEIVGWVIGLLQAQWYPRTKK